MKFVEALERAQDHDKIVHADQWDSAFIFYADKKEGGMWMPSITRGGITQLHSHTRISKERMLSDEWKIVREIKTTTEFK